MIWPTKRSSQLSELGRKESNWRSTKPQICTCSVCFLGEHVYSIAAYFLDDNPPTTMGTTGIYIYISEYPGSLPFRWQDDPQMTIVQAVADTTHDTGACKLSRSKCTCCWTTKPDGSGATQISRRQDASEKMRRKATAKSHLSPSLHPNSYHTCETGWHWEKK